MADHYLDHGLYGAATVNSTHWSTSGTTLTVSAGATVSGQLGIGSCLYGGGLQPYTVITALGTGLGGVGTYTISISQTIVTPGEQLTAKNGQPQNIPLWGVAQDGDGTAIGAATPSTAEIVFTGIPSAGTIAVLGITLSPTWATSADVCANNLATAINASASTATGPASFTVKSQVRNHVYARGPALGAPAGTCQIMTRQASAAHAGLIAVTHTLNNVSSAGTINFTGGTGGAWGWLGNVQNTIWPSALARASYGIWGATQPFTGSHGDGDVVYIRSGNNTILAIGDVSFSLTPPAGISTDEANPTRHIIDNSAKWADGANPKLNIVIASNQYPTINFTNPVALHIQGTKFSDGNYSLNIINLTSTANLMSVVVGRSCRLSGVMLSAPGNISLYAGIVTPPQRGLVYDSKVYSANTFSRPLIGITGSGGNAAYGCDFTNIELSNLGAVSPSDGVLTGASSATDCIIKDCRFTDFVVGSKLHYGTFNSSNKLTLVDCDLGNVTDIGPYVGSASSSMYPNHLAGYSHYAKRDFWLDGAKGLIAWIYNRAQPTLSALLPDGVTRWSMLMAPSAVSGRVTIGSPLKTPDIVKLNSLATGARVFTLEVAICDTQTFTMKDIALEVNYKSSAGQNIRLSTFDYGASALTPSTLTWSNESGGKVVYSDGGTLLHNKYKLSLATPAGHDLPLGEDVVAAICINRTVSNSKEYIFVNPELSIS